MRTNKKINFMYMGYNSSVVQVRCLESLVRVRVTVDLDPGAARARRTDDVLNQRAARDFELFERPLIVEHAALEHERESTELRDLRFLRNEFKLDHLDQSRAANVDRSLF